MTTTKGRPKCPDCKQELSFVIVDGAELGSLYKDLSFVVPISPDGTIGEPSLESPLRDDLEWLQQTGGDLVLEAVKAYAESGKGDSITDRDIVLCASCQSYFNLLSEGYPEPCNNDDLWDGWRKCIKCNGQEGDLNCKMCDGLGWVVDEEVDDLPISVKQDVPHPLANETVTCAKCQETWPILRLATHPCRAERLGLTRVVETVPPDEPMTYEEEEINPYAPGYYHLGMGME